MFSTLIVIAILALTRVPPNPDKLSWVLPWHRSLPGVPGATQQHHPLAGSDGHITLQSDGQPPAHHSLAEERRPGGPGTGTGHHPQD